MEVKDATRETLQERFDQIDRDLTTLHEEMAPLVTELFKRVVLSYYPDATAVRISAEWSDDGPLVSIGWVERDGQVIAEEPDSPGDAAHSESLWGDNLVSELLNYMELYGGPYSELIQLNS